MGLFDIFTGDAYSDAAQKQRDYLSGTLAAGAANIGAAQNIGLGALQAGQAGALGAIGPGFEQARGDISGAFGPSLAALQSGQGAAAGALTSGLGALRSGVGGAIGAYDPLSALSGQYGGYTNSAAQANLDALGLNGPEGLARSRQAFQTTPGYEFARDQAIQGAVRGANVAGMAPSGNTLAALSSLVGNQIAPQQWQQYMSGLGALQSQYAPLALQGTGAAAGGIANANLTGGTGAANIYGGLANLYNQGGRDISGLYTGQGASLADLASRGGLAAANIYSQFAPATANFAGNISQQQTGLLQGIAPQVASTYGAEAAAQTGGSANIWNLGLGLAKLGAGMGGFGGK